MSFGCWINPETGEINEDHLLAKAFEALRCEFGKRMYDFEAFVIANYKRAQLILKVEGRDTQTVVKALRPFAEGQCDRIVIHQQQKAAFIEANRSEFPHMCRMMEKGLL